MVTKILVLFLAGCWFLACGTPRKPLQAGSSAVLDSVVSRPELTLVFSGDVMQHLPQVEAARQADGSYDYTSCFRYIQPLWESADFTVVNLETTLSERGPYSGYPCFASPGALAVALKEAGVDVTALANNHCCDRGAQGIRTTVQMVDSLGFGYVGVYADSAQISREPLMLEKGPYRVALFNYTYGTNGIPVPAGMVVNRIDTVAMGRLFERAQRDSATHIVVFLHWGEEYQQSPNREQLDMARWCRARGADVVVGSHPHVVQPVDTAGRVVWSLGNFVSNQRNRYQEGGLSVRVTLSLSGIGPRIEALPHWVWTPVEGGRKRYYVVPAYVGGREVGMDSVTNVLFLRSLEDNRAVAGAVNEVVL